MGVYLLGFFATALVCHGELVKDRPSTRYLTEFYLLMSVGGAVGVAAGYSWAGIAELKLMWVEEACRGVGHGRKLLDAFVSEAAARGARHVWVSTHDFQAPDLYEKAGFERVAEFTGWPEGHSNIILCKTMAPQ